MNYLINAKEEALSTGQAYQDYFSYLEKNKTKLTQNVYEFATLEWRYNYSDPRCFHDAWVESISILEPFSGARKEIRSQEIHVNLLGPFHDRIIILQYFGVLFYKISNPCSKKGHHDWIIDEISIGSDNIITHFVRFSEGSLWEIGFNDLKYSEKMINKE